jgi:hypothetical protein
MGIVREDEIPFSFKFFALKFQNRIKIIVKYPKFLFKFRGLNSLASKRRLLHTQINKA